MSKIKVGELRETLKQNQKDNVKVAEYNGLQIEIKQYIPFQKKINLVGTMVESATNREDGLHIIDGNTLDLAFKVLLVEEYSNITLPKDYMEAYDLLVSSELYDFIYESIPHSELLDMQTALNNHIQAKQDEYEQKNTVQYIVKDLLSGLIDKMPSKDEAEEFIKMASKEIEGFDPNKMEFVKDFLAKTSGENNERN